LNAAPWHALATVFGIDSNACTFRDRRGPIVTVFMCGCRIQRFRREARQLRLVVPTLRTRTRRTTSACFESLLCNVSVNVLFAPGKSPRMRLLLISNDPAPCPFAVAGSQPALARLAARPTGSAITNASRARAVNRLALPIRLRAIVRHPDDEQRRRYGVLAPVAVSATVNVAP
jgi:hypothetical protein